MSELTDLRKLADDAEALAADLERPIAPRLALGDLLRRELDLQVDGFAAQLRLDALVEEITRLVLADYADAAGDLAWDLRDVAGEDDDEDEDEDDGPGERTPAAGRSTT
jgi:hypothetical protein